MIRAFITFTLFTSSIIVQSEACANYKWNIFTKEPHIAALILARGGSKSIPLKNLARFDNTTLLRNTLEVLRTVAAFNTIWVSTDHIRIAKEADKVNGVQIHWRSPETATDQAPSILAVQEFIYWHKEVNIVALVQCTSPFVKKIYLEQAFELMTQTSDSIDCVFSVTRSYKLRWRKSLNNKVEALNFNVKQRPRRQDWPGEFIENGMFYFTKRSLITDGVFQLNRECEIVEIDEKDSYEVDSPEQLRFVNLIRQLGVN